MANNKIDVTDLDLKITKIEKRTSCGGAWVRGTINDTVRFDALVFADWPTWFGDRKPKSRTRDRRSVVRAA
jgi:hypothetical protein